VISENQQERPSPSLLKELTKVEGIERFRISSIEPNLLTDELIEFTSANKKILPHFHVPLQSGNDRILGLMRRRYKRALFAEKVKLIRELSPFAGIGADVIVGFPSESETDFEVTCDFLEEMPLSYLHVFNFSERPGTHAAGLPEKVPFTVREGRSKLLISLSQRKHLEFCRANIGRVSNILFEHTRDNGMITGFTENYIRVEHQWQGKLAGVVTRARLNDIAPTGRMSVELTV
jgi:threonylcarbamoyladenosine tRNA methylthiotransferase MtaB